MASRSPLNEAVRWLVQPEADRDLALLRVLLKRPFTATELKRATGIEHDAQLHRSLNYLDDRGLLDRFYDTSKTKRGNVYAASAMGRRALELVDHVETYLREHARARA